MEHRWSQRSSLHIGVLLYQNGIPIARCVTRDVGAEGMFVECGSAICKKNAVVQVEFEAPTGSGQSKRFCLPTMVMHVSDEGMGLIFLEVGSEAFLALRHIVKNFEPGLSDDDPANDDAGNETACPQQGRHVSGDLYH